MPDKLTRVVIEKLARLWREFAAVVRLVAGDIDFAGKRTDEPPVGPHGGPGGQAGPDVGDVENEAGVEPASDAGAAAEGGAGLDEYYDVIDGFMDEIGSKSDSPAETGRNDAEKPPEQGDK
ncbi:MAG: hypothetical protein HZA50_04930 [Planctomycetes bacterium]|nr:hypothetical protein [Planctomycetota bacterium]